MIIKPLSLFIALTLIHCNLFSQNLSGSTTWEGKLLNLRLVLKLSKDSLKEATAVFDSPDQGVVGLKVSKLKLDNDSIYAFVPSINATYAGKFNPEKSTLSGNWSQTGQSFPLVLSRTANEVLVRPQTPKPPFPYTEEKMIYFNQDKSIQYGATLTVPHGGGKYPVVILITGSGSQDRDETLFDHKPFWVIADHLSRNGITVLRVDDRGVGQTTGEVRNATSADFAKDVLVGVDYLKSRKDIDLANIGLIGHSEGGVIAPIAANQSKDIAFIISLAGVGIKGADLMNKQMLDSYRRLTLNTKELEKMKLMTQMLLKLNTEYPDINSLKNAFEKSMKEWLADQPDTLLLKTGLEGPNADKNISNMAMNFYNPWMRYFLRYDPSLTLSKIQIPVLALNGGKDVQVRAEENLAGFEKYLKQAGNKNYKTVLLPNLNHLFQTAQTGEVNEYRTIEETIAPEVLNIMTDWIKKTKR